MAKEQINNVPNPITLSRVIATPLIMWGVIAGTPLMGVMFAFILAAFTDFIDGFLARKLDQVTEFGRKFDIVADRILMIGTIAALIIRFTQDGSFTNSHYIQVALIMSREIIAAPFAIYGLINKKGIPEARDIGKLTTVLQAIAFPLLIVDVVYGTNDYSLYAALATSLVGLISGMYYIKDMHS